MQIETPELTNDEAVIPASFAQQRMWFLERIEGGAVYNVPVTTRLRGTLDLDALERALEALIERHESLRTVFRVVDAVLQQVIRPPRPFSLDVVDVSGLPDAEDRALELAAQAARAPFDLATEAPFRAQVIAIGDDDHLLSLTLHHIATDAWSTGVLNRELAELYTGFCAGEPVELPELQIQYADYAVWQRQWMESGGLDEQLAYWRGRLAGAPPLLELATDHPRPSTQSFRGATERVVLPLELLEQVRVFGERQRATMFMTLLATFSALLARYSGQEDVVVASPVANRSRPELEGVVGLFVNTLPLRVELEGDPSFSELVSRVREVALGAFANQDLPFEKLVEKLAPERHLSHAPVAQTMFVAQSAVDHPVTFPGLEQERVLTERNTAKFDLTFFVAETPQGLRLSLEYCTDLFERATAVRLLEHYHVLLEAALADPDRPVSELRLLTEAEEQIVLHDWNQTTTNYPPERLQTVHELVAARSRLTPDAPAVSFAGEELTYAQLDARANQLARHLRGLGVEPGAVVAICAERSVEMMVAVLAVLKAGSAYAPIDPNYPEERVAYMLADSDAPVLLTQQHLLAGLPAHSARVVCLDGDRDEIAAENEAPIDSGATLEDLAYVIYTSGSTGRPKGVAMPHRPLANLLAWQLDCFAEQRSDPARTLQFASLSFDVAFQELFSTWCSGGCLVLIDEDARRDPEALLALLAEQRVERLFLPFVALHNLCEAAGYLDATLPSLREVITAGEQLKVTDAVEAFFARHSRCTLVNHYGPTESHVITAFALSGKPDEWPALPPIGKPIANGKVYLLDPHRQPVPIGVPGELWIGGTSLARGYLARPELTAERFVPDPFSSDPEARLYRTGDLARYRADGEIDYLGRADQQLKIRGFRVEPGEVESALRAHDAVREALVVARADDHGGKHLVAYLIGDETRISPGELREFLGRSLPEYMIPSAFATLEAFPLSPNGKVDRAALPVPADVSRGSDEHVSPQTAVQQSVAEIWQRLLNVDRVGIYDNFFALGGHSLLATQLVSRVRDTLGLELPLRSVFESPTVASFAEAIETASGGPVERSTSMPILPVPREPRRLEHAAAGENVFVLPASFAEQRLWFLDRLVPDSGAYNLALARRLHGRLDVGALEHALDSLVARHETLRTTFSLIDDVPRRVIREHARLPLRQVDLTAPGGQERALELVQEEARRGFDLETGPLIRANLLQLGDEEHIFVLTLHHIVVDGWSMGVLNRELGALYGAFADGTPLELPELSVQYGDYAAWQQEWIESGGLDSQLDYWKSRLAGAPSLLELPADRPRPPRQSARGAVVRSVLPASLHDRLKSLGEQEGTTPFMTLLAAFAALLARHSSQKDIVVASPVANRERSELEGLIGFFVNTLPFRVDLEGNPTFRELLARVRECALGGFTNQELPFEKLVEELNPERHLSSSPIAQVFFALQTAVGESTLELRGLTQEPVRGARLTTKFDLSMYAVETPDGLRVSLEYATDLFDESTVARMLEHYRMLLEGAVDDPDAQVATLPMLTQPELQTLLVEWNDTTRQYPDRLVPELIGDQVRRTPDAVAVRDEDETLTYAELDVRANQVAHHLVAAGVGPDVLVGICVDRSVTMAVGVLAILKAGGAYVPIDPEYPADRQAYMLANSQAPVVLTQERLRARLAESDALVVSLDGDWPAISTQPEEAPAVTVSRDHLSYVIYTSGSTGEPKGVQLPHGALANLLLTMRESPGLTADDILLAVTTLSFDIASLELLLPLISGAQVVIAQAAATIDPNALIDLIDRSGATVLQATPTTWKMLVDADWGGRPGMKGITGGEALTIALADALLARGLELWNCYGPSETTIYSTRSHVAHSGGPITIGRPLANTQLYILDEAMGLVPPGVPGELWIGGAGLARGYRGRPDLTEERFVRNPFDPDDGARIYRTGDTARYLADGRVEYLGRADHQVKIRGFRIEPGEIENSLRAHPAVREAVVVARPGANADLRLVAYVIAATPPPTVPELRELLSDRLPKYMVPSAFVFLDAFPQTPNGKIDRATLLRAPLDAQPIARELTAPRTATEQRLAQIWKKLLELDEVGIDDDFFELGGHSLAAVRLTSEIERKLGVRLPLSALFETATIAGLAGLVDASGSQEAEWPALVPLLSGNGHAPLFLVGWADGEVLPYRGLIENLNTDVPVIGLLFPGVDRRTPPLGSVEALADFFVEEIRRVQPHGPYRLGGYCFSGLVAYEMARRLERSGEATETLALLDSYPWRPPRRRPLLGVGRAQMQALKTADRAGRREWLRGRMRGIAARVHNLVYIKVGPRVYEVLSERNLQRLLPHRPWNLVLIASNLARMRYVPEPLDIRADFFRAQQAPDARPTPFDQLATRGVTLREIIAPGIDHESMMQEPHVRLLADELARYLASANGNGAGDRLDEGASAPVHLEEIRL